MINNLHTTIFKNASKTYYYSSLFFPKDVRDDIFILYGFVRTADDLVDSIPQQVEKYNLFVERFRKGYSGDNEDDIVISSFIGMMKRRKISLAWVESFLEAMKSDIHKSKYQTIKELENYIYGSAGVIGLMMAKILKLPEESYTYAQMLGSSMQLSNFIRDLQEDNELGRCYFPQTDLKKFNLKSLKFSEVTKKKNEFRLFMDFQIERYFNWQNIAENGFKYIPKRYRIAIKTASDMYKKTQLIISKNPAIVFKRKVKPSPFSILLQGVKNSFSNE